MAWQVAAVPGDGGRHTLQDRTGERRCRLEVVAAGGETFWAVAEPDQVDTGPGGCCQMFEYRLLHQAGMGDYNRGVAALAYQQCAVFDSAGEGIVGINGMDADVRLQGVQNGAPPGAAPLLHRSQVGLAGPGPVGEDVVENRHRGDFAAAIHQGVARLEPLVDSTGAAEDRRVGAIVGRSLIVDNAVVGVKEAVGKEAVDAEHLLPGVDLPCFARGDDPLAEGLRFAGGIAFAGLALDRADPQTAEVERGVAGIADVRHDHIAAGQPHRLHDRHDRREADRLLDRVVLGRKVPHQVEGMRVAPGAVGTHEAVQKPIADPEAVVKPRPDRLVVERIAEQLVEARPQLVAEPRAERLEQVAGEGRAAVGLGLVGEDSRHRRAEMPADRPVVGFETEPGKDAEGLRVQQVGQAAPGALGSRGLLDDRRQPEAGGNFRDTHRLEHPNGAAADTGEERGLAVVVAAVPLGAEPVGADGTDGGGQVTRRHTAAPRHEPRPDDPPLIDEPKPAGAEIRRRRLEHQRPCLQVGALRHDQPPRRAARVGILVVQPELHVEPRRLRDEGVDHSEPLVAGERDQVAGARVERQRADAARRAAAQVGDLFRHGRSVVQHPQRHQSAAQVIGFAGVQGVSFVKSGSSALGRRPFRPRIGRPCAGSGASCGSCAAGAPSQGARRVASICSSAGCTFQKSRRARYSSSTGPWPLARPAVARSSRLRAVASGDTNSTIFTR